MGNASPVARADDLEEHRINVPMGTSDMDGWAPAKKKGADGKWHLDYTFDDAFLLELKRRGMKVMYSWGGPGSFGPDHIIAASRHFLEIGLTYDDFCFQAGPDEFFPKDVPSMVERGQRYRAEAPGIRFMVDVIPQVGADSIEKLTPYVDVWVPLLNRLYPQTEAARERLAVFRQTGGKLWAYDCAVWMNAQPLMDYYRLKPWKAWKVGLDGIAYWTYNSWQGDGFDPFDNKRHQRAGDNGMIYQGARKDVIVSSKHYEALREGIEDYCYLHLLKQAIEAGMKRGKPTGEAEALLSRCVDDVLANTNDPDLIDRYRTALAKQIVRLRMETVIGRPPPKSLGRPRYVSSRFNLPGLDALPSAHFGQIFEQDPLDIVPNAR